MIIAETHCFYPTEDKKSFITIHRIESRAHGKATCFKLEGGELNEHELEYETWGRMAQVLNKKFNGKFAEQFPDSEEIKFIKK